MNTKELLKLVDEKYEQRRSLKNRLEQQWTANLLGYRGFMWLQPDISDVTTVLQNQDVERNYEPSVVVNHILPLVTQRIATMTKTKPIMTTIPKTADMADIDKARYTDAAIDFAWQKFALVRKLITTLLDTEICGKSFWKIIWNPRVGEDVEKVVDYKEKEVDGVPSIEPVMKKVKSGEIEIVPVSGFNILIDPLARNDEDVTWMLHFYAKPVKQVAFMHGLRDEELKEDDGIYDNMLDQRLGNVLGNQTTNSSLQEKAVIVKELYYAPDNSYPDGLYAKVAGGKLLEYTTMSKDKWPFVSFCMTENTDSFWGEGIITHILPINQELNDVRSHLIAHQKLMVYPYWVNPPESGVDDDELENAMGAILHVSDSNKEHHPYRIDIPDFPAELFQMGDVYVHDMEQIANIHAASRGQNPEGTRSAASLSAQQESDQMALGPSAIMLEESLTRAVKKILENMKEHYDQTRMLSVVGENGIPEVQAFVNDKIVVDDLRVTLFSSLPRSRAGQTQYLMDLLDRQVFTADKLPKVLDAFGIGSLASILDENKIVEEESKREFWDLLNNDILPRVYEFQDHQSHGKGHTLSMMGFQAKSMWDIPYGQNGGQDPLAFAPEQQDQQTGQVIPAHMRTYGEIMMGHYHAHQAVVQQLAMQQMQLQVQMQQVGQPSPEDQMAAIKQQQDMELEQKTKEKIIDHAIQQSAQKETGKQELAKASIQQLIVDKSAKKNEK